MKPVSESKSESESMISYNSGRNQSSVYHGVLVDYKGTNLEDNKKVRWRLRWSSEN
jgi:hypothetical protein